MGKYSNILQSNSGGGKYSKMLKSSTLSSAFDTDTNAPLIGEFPEQVISGGKMSDTVSKDRPLSKEQIAYAQGLPQTSVKDERQYLGAGYESPSEESRKALLDAITLKDAIETGTKGREQMMQGDPINVISGALNVALGIGHIVTSPFNVADKSLRAVGGAAKTIAEVTAYPFEKIGEGVVNADEFINKSFNDFLKARGLSDKDRESIMNLGFNEKEMQPLREALQGANQFAAQLLVGKVMHSTANIIKKIGAPKATEIIKQGKENGLTIPEIDELYAEKINGLQALYNERNVRMNQRDKLTGSNQKFMDMLVGKLDEQIKPLEKELGVKATKIEEPKPVEGLTQEVPVNKLIQQRADETQRSLPPSYIEQGLGTDYIPPVDKPNYANNQAFIEGTNKKSMPDNSATQLDLVEAEIKAKNNAENVQNTPISSIEAQGKEIVPKSIESISPEVQALNIVSKEAVFGETIKDEITNLNSANDAIKFAEKYKGNEEVIKQVQLERDNVQAQATEALKNDLPDAELLQGKASILNDAVNELNKSEVTNAKEGMQRGQEEIAVKEQQQKSPEFKQWFGDWENEPQKASKAVDENGKPKVLYHGTTANFNEFKVGEEGGIFFSDHPGLAEGYINIEGKIDINGNEIPYKDFGAGDLNRLNGNTMPAYLDMKNPKIIDFKGQEKFNYATDIRQAKSEGYDGIIAKNVFDYIGEDSNYPGEFQNQYIVFDPKQIKSAVGNKGTFNKSSSNILYSTIIPLPHPETLRAIKASFNENLPIVKDVLARGGKLAYEGIRDFKDWSAEMTKLYGDAIQPHLQRVWLQVQNTGKNDNEFNRQLINYAREKEILPSKFSRAGKEIDIEKATANIREMLDKGATEEDFIKVIKQGTFESPQEQARYELLRNKMGKEISGGEKLTTNELKEYENLKAKTRGDLESEVLNNLRAKHKVVEDNPLLKAVYQTKFEASRKAEVESISLKTNFNDLIDASRQSTGDKYDTRVLKALAGEKVSLTPAEQKLYEALVEFRTKAGKTKTNATLIKNYDFPLKQRGFVEAYRNEGLMDALKEKFKKVDAREVDHLIRSYSKENMFDPFSMKRFGRTENPTMDLKARLNDYIDVYAIQKNLEPILPAITRLEKAMVASGLPNNVLWSQKYTKELFGEAFDTGVMGERQLNKTIRILNNVASIRWLALNPTGGLGNLIAGLGQNWVSPDLTLKENLIGAKRVFTEQGFDILTERGIIDATGAGKVVTNKDIAKQVANPYVAYTAGEHIIQGQFYLGKLTPEEFRSKIISASRDRQILETKSDAQGAYHKGLRPDIVRTTLGAGVTKFRLWLPAVLESKVQKIMSAGRLAESIYKGLVNKSVQAGKENLTTKDVKNLKGLLTEVTTLGSAVLLLNEMSEDKRKFLESALNNAYGFLKGENIARQISNILPAAQTVTDIIIAISSLGDKYEVDTEYGNEGDDKGVGGFKKLAPVIIKPLLKNKVPKEIEEINKLESKVNELRKKAEKGSTSDVILYNAFKQRLETKKERSRLYQQRLEKKQLESERTEEKLNR